MLSLLAHLVNIALASAASILPAQPLAPTIILDNGTFIGVSSGLTESFLGIPFAQPPTGDRRFRLPVPNTPYTGVHTSIAFGPACPQKNNSDNTSLPSGLDPATAQFLANLTNPYGPQSEDCLSINVVRPSGTTAVSKLPVAVWIFGGGFSTGSPIIYNGAAIVARSLQLGEPVIYVSLNYRLNGFGFLGSKEIKDAGVGNLGLQDQRQALRWVQKYIGVFGGDASKVTIWGESAGAISVALHMVSNGGVAEGLFRGGFMESGAAIPVGDITKGQVYYDDIVSNTGCSAAADTLACLRTAPFEQLKVAIDNVFKATPDQSESLALLWFPRPDGNLLTDQPEWLVNQGKIARIPFVSGCNDDEGTLFAVGSLNITTDAEFAALISTNFFPGISWKDLATLLIDYPQDITQGSPFNTGALNAITPQFKRIAAVLGDIVFQGPRRFLLENTAGKQKSWSYLSKRFKDLPVLGSAHASELANVYGGGEMADYLIRFVATLNPNGLTGIPWPEYNSTSRRLLTFLDGLVPLTITTDDYRSDAIAFVTQLAYVNPL